MVRIKINRAYLFVPMSNEKFFTFYVESGNLHSKIIEQSVEYLGKRKRGHYAVKNCFQKK